jgi:hypothetical protein
MSGTYSDINRNFDHVRVFRDLADRICSISNDNGVKVIGYRDPQLPLFNALPVTKQVEVLSRMKIYLHSLEVVEATDSKFENSENVLWHSLSALGLVPPSDMFRRFKSNDIIEIYDLQGIQIWRNFNFLRICSYTLEEMHSLEWHNRYTREEAKSAECLSHLENLLSGKTSDVFFCDISEHVLEETNSTERYVLQVRHDWAGRLKDRQHQIAAWFLTSQVEILDSKAAAQPKPRLSVVPSAPQPELS